MQILGLFFNEGLPDIADNRAKVLINQFYERVLVIAQEVLTAKQMKVFALLLLGKYTQDDIADLLNRTQSTISKTILGCAIYSGKYAGQTHGGIINKLRKHCAKDEKCNRIIAELNGLIAELKSKGESDDKHI